MIPSPTVEITSEWINVLPGVLQYPPFAAVLGLAVGLLISAVRVVFGVGDRVSKD